MRTRFNLLWAAFALTIFSYGFVLQDKGWVNPQDKTPITGATAAKVIKADASNPESVLRYFYASHLKRTTAWKSVSHKLESEWTVKMKAAMNAYNHWTFKKVVIQKKRNLFDNETHFMISYEATEKGKPKNGTGEAVVTKVNNRWEVHEVPY